MKPGKKKKKKKTAKGLDTKKKKKEKKKKGKKKKKKMPLNGWSPSNKYSHASSTRSKRKMFEKNFSRELLQKRD